MAKNKDIGRPPKHTPKMLRAILLAMLKPYTGLDDVAKRYKVSVQAIFRWQKQSAQDEADDIADSPFLIDYLGTRSYFHRHMAFVRAVAVARIDHRIIEAATSPHREPLFSAQTGIPFWEVDARRAADAKTMDQETFELAYGEGANKSDIYKRDVNNALIPMFREVPAQPALLIKAAASLLSATYGERVAHTHMIGGVVRIGPTMAPAPKQLAQPPTFQILDADFTPVEEEKASEPTNVLMIADEPETVEEYERTFGGKRLVEAILFYAEDKTLLAPLPEIIIVEGSSIHRAYREAGIEVDAVPASQLLAQGYCNDFLLALATPEERKLAEAKLKEPVVHQVPVRASQPPLAPSAVDATLVAAAKDNRVSRDPFMTIDGKPKPGGFGVDGERPRRRTVV
jgi:hypothetical protein